MVHSKSNEAVLPMILRDEPAAAVQHITKRRLASFQSLGTQTTKSYHDASSPRFKDFRSETEYGLDESKSFIFEWRRKR